MKKKLTHILKGIAFFLLIVFSNVSGNAQTIPLWGINGSGGTPPPGSPAAGNIYSINSDGSNFIQRHCFTYTNDAAGPFGNVMQANNGLLYGMTNYGGTGGGGVIFNYDVTTNTYTKLLDFSDGTNDASAPYGNLIQANNGLLYGMTNTGGTAGLGVLFSFDTGTNTYAKLLDFGDASNDASSPYGSLIKASNGLLYGMTSAGGTVGLGVLFSFDTGTNTYAKLLDFGDASNDASLPYGSLMQASNGLLYGMTSAGGTTAFGVIFTYDITTSTYNKVHDFDAAGGGAPQLGILTETANNMLYGMTNIGGVNSLGTIFSLDPSSNAFTDVFDFTDTTGNSPFSSLTYYNGNLYGMTSSGGTFGGGTVFTYDPVANNFLKILDFNTANGYNPYSDMVLMNNGRWYGMTLGGGSTYDGVLFSMDEVTNVYRKEINFYDSATGRNPTGKPLIANDGNFYGLASGGNNGYGLLYKLDTLSNAYSILYQFDVTNGAYPAGSLMQAENGKLYGTTTWGGTDSAGVIFSYDITNNTFTKLYDFNYVNGNSPAGGLLQFSDSLLYGCAGAGGDSLTGTMFSYNIFTNVVTKLYNFHNSVGINPNGDLILASDGLVYGTTHEGGSFQDIDLPYFTGGVLYSYNPANGNYNKLHDFGYSFGANVYDGNLPSANVTEANNGKLYGTTSFGIGQRGLYSYDPATGSYTHPIPFAGATSVATGNYLQGSNGKLYAAAIDGATIIGRIFEYNPASNSPVYNTTSTIGYPDERTGLTEAVLSVNDAGIAAIISPDTANCTVSITPVVRLRNWGSAALTSATVNYQLDNGTVSSVSWSGNLAHLSATVITLPTITTTAGTHTFRSFTTLPNGVADANNVNDTSEVSFTIQLTALPAPLTESFNAATFPPVNYALFNPDNGITWQRTNAASHSGAGSMMADNYNYANIGEVDELMLPHLDLTPLSSPVLKFWTAYRMYDDPLLSHWGDTLEVLISTDCGETYTSVYKKGGDSLATTVPHFQPVQFVPTASQWRQETVDLSSFSSADNTMIKFRNITMFENDLYVDDINIQSSLGVNELSPSLNAEIFPNPGNGNFNLNMRQADAKNIKLTVTDALGNTVLQKQYDSGIVTDVIDLSGHTEGFYLLKMQSDKSAITRKLIITK